MRYASLYERLIANSEKAEDQNENGCWLWTGKTDKKPWPYGQLNVRVSGKHTTLRAHRAMFGEILRRPLLTDETVDHLCGQWLCVNPDHLEIVSREENSRRSQQANPRVPNRFTRALASAIVQSSD